MRLTITLDFDSFCVVRDFYIDISSFPRVSLFNCRSLQLLQSLFLLLPLPPEILFFSPEVVTYTWVGSLGSNLFERTHVFLVLLYSVEQVTYKRVSQCDVFGMGRQL